MGSYWTQLFCLSTDQWHWIMKANHELFGKEAINVDDVQLAWTL